MDLKHGFNRRNFIKSSMLGTAGAFVSTSAISGQAGTKKTRMSVITRKLGRTGMELPVVSFGVMRSDSANLIRSALEMGYVHFDTAYSYMNGRNELMLGETLKDYPRDSFVISTKVHADDLHRQTFAMGPGSTKEAFLAKFEESLSRLQMDYVDILYFHQPPTAEVALAPQYLEALSEMKAQGKARFVGLSTHQNEPDLIQAAIDGEIYDVVLVAFNFKHQLADQIKEKIRLANEKGLGIVGMKPMAGAYMDAERQRPLNCKAALKWVLQNSDVHTTIPGITTFEMLVENFSVMEDLELNPDEKADLEEAEQMAGIYCGGCDQCTRQCKKQLPVHEIMRAYMYAYGYKHFENAYTLMASHGLSSEPCSDCDGCTVSCPKGVMVTDRIAGVSRLMGLPGDMLV